MAMTFLLMEVSYCSRIYQKIGIFDICLLSRPDKKSVKEWSNGHDCITLRCSLVCKDSQNIIWGLYLIHKRHNVKLKIYLESS